jgi:hypothetical protein
MLKPDNPMIEIANYQKDVDLSIRLYFTSINPSFIIRFAGYSLLEVDKELTERIKETDARSALAVMAHIEAVFRVDYKERCQRKKPDPVSIEFRKIHKRRRRVRLDEDIWQTWREQKPSTRALIGELRGAFKFRHWLAHGRYWRVGQRYDFQSLYLLANAVLSNFDLHA